ncbi:MAG: MFS transporter, partial [Pseudomonadota bacterium]
QIAELLIFGKPVVLWTAFAITVFSLLALYVFWIYQKYWELQGVPLQSYGYIWAAFALTVSVSARFAGSLEKLLGTHKLLALIAAMPLLGLLGMVLGSGWIGVAFGLLIQLSRGLSLSLFYEALNSRVPGDFRATVNSLVSLGVRVMFIVTGPLLGYALDSIGMESTLLLILAVFTPLLGIVLVPLIIRIQRERAEHEREAATAN